MIWNLGQISGVESHRIQRDILTAKGRGSDVFEQTMQPNARAEGDLSQRDQEMHEFQREQFNHDDG